MIVFRGDNNRGQLGLVSPDEKCVRLPTKVSTFCDGRHISRLISDSNYTYVLARKKRQRSRTTSNLFNNPETFPDLTFVTQDGNVICHAHRNVLCVNSPYFGSMFKSEMKESQMKEFPVENSKEVFMCLMKHIYEVEMDEIRPDIVPELYQAADYYQVPGLKELCFRVLDEDLTLKNVGGILQDVHTRQFDDLEQICIRFIVENLKSWTEKTEYNNQITSVVLMAKVLKATVHP